VKRRQASTFPALFLAAQCLEIGRLQLCLFRKEGWKRSETCILEGGWLWLPRQVASNYTVQELQKAFLLVPAEWIG